MADIPQLVHPAARDKAQGANHRSGSVLGQHGDREDALLLHALAAVVLLAQGDGHQRRVGGGGLGNLHHGVGDAGVGAAAVLYADSVHPVGKVSQN